MPQTAGRGSDPSAEWVRSYHIRLYFVDPECIKDAFDISFDDVASCVGKVSSFAHGSAVWLHCLQGLCLVFGAAQEFTAALLGLLAIDARRSGEGKVAAKGSSAPIADVEVGVVASRARVCVRCSVAYVCVSLHLL